MSFTFPVSVQELLSERIPSLRTRGISQATIDDVRSKVEDLWRDGPGGWAHEWSAQAAQAESQGNSLLAAMLYGTAKFPCLANAAHRTAYTLQRDSYLRAGEQLPQHFERHVEMIDYRGTTTPVPVHVLSDPNLTTAAPVLLYMGGVDTWKMDVHYSAVALGQMIGAHVVLVDIPGTGESQVALAADADVILRQVIERYRQRGSGQVVVCGYSFGGLWSTKLALLGVVDAAVAIGAPIDATFTEANIRNMPLGMDGVLGNAIGLTSQPDARMLAAALKPLSLREQGLFDWSTEACKTPLLTINGELDPFVPASEVLIFKERPNTMTKLYPDAHHCAAERSAEVITFVGTWLKEALATFAPTH